MTDTANPLIPGPDGQPIRMDRPMTDAEVKQALGDDDVAETTVVTRTALTDQLAEVIRLLEPIDLDAEVKAIEGEALPVGDDRPAAVRNRADRAELARQFVALKNTGGAIVRRLDDDAQGRDRDE